MNPLIETEDWKLGCYLEWRPKMHSETCPSCNGHGEVGGGFKSLDGPRQCNQCFGVGSISKHPTTKMPEIPPDLREHLRRAWYDFTTKQTT